jgi:hypothetical protein
MYNVSSILHLRVGFVERARNHFNIPEKLKGGWLPYWDCIKGNSEENRHMYTLETYP